MGTLDAALSLATAKQINSKAQTRFDNAYKAALLTEGSTYVQGFLVFAGDSQSPLEHSWVELADHIVDPTLPHFDRNAEDLHYFAAHRLTLKQLTAILEESKEDYPEDDPLPVYGAPPYEYYGDLMLGGKDYLEAYKNAEAMAAELKEVH